jgi:hypothetical protein
MQLNGKFILGAAVAVGGVIGAGALLAACSGGGPKVAQDGPMADLTKTLMQDLKPGSLGRNPRLSVTSDAYRQVQNDDGRTTGAYDGAALLRAADSHAYGTPAIGDPAIDVQNDGFATFNEVRHVVRHFDADNSGAYDLDELRAFEGAAGIRWIPA